MGKRNRPILLTAVLLSFLFFGICACSREEAPVAPVEVPRGYVQKVVIEKGDRVITFGPFVGYYFRPQDPNDLGRLDFLCFNERSYYTLDLPENTMLFEGEAVLQTLADVEFIVPADDRINPLLFADVPPEWLENRPAPQDEFVHFHSAYDALGSVLTGYWIKHVGTATFTYDMGGRVGEQSVLYHRVKPGVDKFFAHIMEFDKGPSL
ncbi:MAG: hypothetical protein V2I36_15715 [Desulfopila sp.]|jgi:hypothetical protein|nr:hypothetical protein [Desulfopila sp.]